jgi:hypothetical protein
VSLKLSISVAEPYGFISRFDSAITLPPPPDPGPPPERLDGEDDAAFKARADVWAAPINEWRRPLDVARETGDYAPILRADAKPTIFRLRQIVASRWAALDRYTAALANTEHAQLLFRVGVVGLDGDFPVMLLDRKYDPARDPRFEDLGPIRPECFVDAFTGAEKVIDEIARHLVAHRHAPGN